MIQLFDISKKYSGKLVLDKINYTFEKGKVYCLLGKNGVGKSTLLNIMGGMVQQDSGKVECNTNSLKDNVGFLCEESGLIDELDMNQYLYLIGLLQGMGNKEIRERIKFTTQFFSLEGFQGKLIKNLSFGTRKKIEICATSMHNPEVLLLDEPYSGLDSVSCENLTYFLNDLANEDKIVILSSHIINYIEKLNPIIIFIEEGKIVYSGRITEFLENDDVAFYDKTIKMLKNP